MTVDEIKKFLLSKKGYITKEGVLKKGYNWLAEKTNSTKINVKRAVQEIRSEINFDVERSTVGVRSTRPNIIVPSSNTGNILVIGDLHSPFILDGYLEWCKSLEKKYNTKKTIFIGDVIDGHSWSYHESDVDGMSVGYELDAAIKQLKLAYKLFPNADVTLGNHDLLIARKARTAGLSQRFLKDFKEIIDAPSGWNIGHEFIYDNVRYIHGSVGNAYKRAIASRISTVQGHLHTQAFIQYSVSERDAIYGLQIGCGIDHDKYAFEYAKPLPQKPIISAGIVTENGTLPILELMKL